MPPMKRATSSRLVSGEPVDFSLYLYGYSEERDCSRRGYGSLDPPAICQDPTRSRLTPVNPQEAHMKLSARNVLRGKLLEVKKGQTTAHVRIDVGGSVVTASITNEAVDELRLTSGQTAYAVIKASDVMIAID